MKSSIPSVRTRRVRLPFTGPEAAGFSDFGLIRVRLARVILQPSRQAESTMSSTTGYANAALMYLHWSMTTNAGWFSKSCGPSSL